MAAEVDISRTNGYTMLNSAENDTIQTSNKKSRLAQKRQKRKLAKKQKKAAKVELEQKKDELKPVKLEDEGEDGVADQTNAEVRVRRDGRKKDADATEIEYVAAPVDIDIDEETMDQAQKQALLELKDAISKFTGPNVVQITDGEENEENSDDDDNKNDQKEEYKDSSDESDDNENRETKSRRKMKLEKRMKVAELKRLSSKPELVEIWDVTAPDPKLLVHLKGCRNSVPVPRHWSQKRRYLQGKRGMEKPTFELPSFIKATGIQDIRQAYQEKEDAKKLKQKQRERVQPKMGKMDIDYQINLAIDQVLHDAFFKYQTKPRLSSFGDLYYEGKEYETKMADKRPGYVSPQLKAALNMADGAPPPWLINMQRYGPPPSYPSLKIPGLNAPIPIGAQFGYHIGGWGQPPVDEMGRPIYGDVFGFQNTAVPAGFESQRVDKTYRWGKIEEAEESEEEEEEDEEMEEEEEEGKLSEDQIADGTASGMASIASLPSGAETPMALDLRKKSGIESVGNQTPQLYQVLEKKETKIGAGQFMGSSHGYVVPSQGSDADSKTLSSAAAAAKKANITTGGRDVDVALAPEELENLDDATLASKYAAQLEVQKTDAQKEDFSDMVAEQAAKAKKKRDVKDSKEKKYKEVKF